MSAFVATLPRREGERPEVGDIVPHRQMSQRPGEAMRGRIEDVVDGVRGRFGGCLEVRRSGYERHNEALFVASRVLEGGGNALPEEARLGKGEVAHVHPELSVHMYLSPADARGVIERGWGERHRLTTRAGRWIGLGRTWIMIYAPRDEGELEVLRGLLTESVQWMTGQKGEKQ